MNEGGGRAKSGKFGGLNRWSEGCSCNGGCFCRGWDVGCVW